MNKRDDTENIMQSNTQPKTEDMIPLDEESSFMDKQRSVKFLGKKVFGLTRLKPMSQEDLDDRGPFLIWIDEDGTGEIYEQQKPGRIEIIEGKYNILHDKKLLTLYLPDGRYFKTWIHYANETNSYPLEPMMDAELGYQTVTNIQANIAALKEARKLGDLKMWVRILKLAGWVALGIIGIWLVGDLFGFWDNFAGMLGRGAETAAATVGENTSQNLTEQIAAGKVTEIR